MADTQEDAHAAATRTSGDAHALAQLDDGEEVAVTPGMATGEIQELRRRRHPSRRATATAVQNSEPTGEEPAPAASFAASTDCELRTLTSPFPVQVFEVTWQGEHPQMCRR